MAAIAPDSNTSVRITTPARQGQLHRFRSLLPSVFVLIALAGTAYWGHSTVWKFVEAYRAAPLITVETPRHSTARVVDGTRIEFDSAEEIERYGIQVSTVWQTKLTEQTSAPGEVTFEPNRVARLSARAGGVAGKVMKTTGDSVRAGELLALLDSNEVAKAKADFQHSLVQTRLRKRTRDDLVAAKDAASQATVREAEAAANEADVHLMAATQKLINLGLPVRVADYRDLTPAQAAQRLRLLGTDETVERDSGIATTNLLPIRSSLSGVVLTVNVVAGEIVEAGKVLFTVVDPGRMRITLHLNPQNAKRAAVGQNVFFRPDGGSREYPAVVVAIGASADETSRTVPVLADAENTDGSLRANALGRGRIVFREVPKTLVVPTDAVQQFRGHAVVFVRDPGFLNLGSPKAFETRIVRIGGRDEQNLEVLEGLSVGEIVVTKGSGALLEEWKRVSADR